MRQVAIPKTDANGLLLSTVTAVMKSLRTNDPAPFTFLLRERLKDRSHRRALNVMLNNWAMAIASEDAKAKRQANSKKRATRVGRGHPPMRQSETSYVNDPTPAVRRERDGFIATRARARLGISKS